MRLRAPRGIKNGGQGPPIGGGEVVFLLRAVALRPRDEDLSNRFTELNAGNVVHREMNAAPDSRIAGFLAHGTNEVSARGEQIGQHFRLGRRERRVVGRIAWK